MPLGTLKRAALPNPSTLPGPPPNPQRVEIVQLVFPAETPGVIARTVLLLESVT